MDVSSSSPAATDLVPITKDEAKKSKAFGRGGSIISGGGGGATTSAPSSATIASGSTGGGTGGGTGSGSAAHGKSNMARAASGRSAPAHASLALPGSGATSDNAAEAKDAKGHQKKASFMSRFTWSRSTPKDDESALREVVVGGSFSDERKGSYPGVPSPSSAATTAATTTTPATATTSTSITSNPPSTSPTPYNPGNSSNPLARSTLYQRTDLQRQATQLLQRRLDEFFKASTKDIDMFMANQHTLQTRRFELEKMIQNLHQEEAELEKVVAASIAKSEEMEDWIARMEQPRDLDDLVTPEDPLSNQLLNVIAEDIAFEDVLYYLGKGLAADKIDLDTYLKETRSISRQQFFVRGLAMKINNMLGREDR